jgi:hypothetical protein
MLRSLPRWLFLLAVVVASFETTTPAQAHNRRPSGCLPYYEPSRPDLFYNYYIGPGCGTAAAEMYPSPLPTPPLVGHTYYTYQPFYPQEWLYHHHRDYHHYYDYGRGLNRTHVWWW